VDSDDKVSLNIPLRFIVKASYSRHASCTNVGGNFLTMDRITDFIKNFDPSVFGLDSWDLWIGFGLLVLIFVLLNWATSFLQPTIGRTIKKILAIAFYSVFIGLLFFMLLNSLLTERYDRLTMMIFILILPYLKRLVGNFYKRYDEVVDRRISRD
jgi:hypothetical protein